MVDAGGGAMTRAAAEAAARLGKGHAVAGLAPAHAPQLVDVMRASVADLAARGPVGVFRTPQDLQAQGGLDACLAVVDMAPADAELTAAQLWTLAKAEQLGWTSPASTACIPAEVSVTAVAVEAPLLRQEVHLRPNALAGVALQRVSSTGWTGGLLSLFVTGLWTPTRRRLQWTRCRTPTRGWLWASTNPGAAWRRCALLHSP